MWNILRAICWRCRCRCRRRQPNDNMHENCTPLGPFARTASQHSHSEPSSMRNRSIQVEKRCIRGRATCSSLHCTVSFNIYLALGLFLVSFFFFFRSVVVLFPSFSCFAQMKQNGIKIERRTGERESGATTGALIGTVSA